MGLMKKLTSAIVASSLVLSLVGTASAGITDNPEAGAERMHELGLIQGREDGDLALGDPITRAELVTIIVRAFGKDDLAQLVQDANVFPDTADHWANGYVAIAKQLIEANGYGLGYEDGTFKPDNTVTAAEAVAFLAKFLGVQPDTTLSWPMDYIQGAVDAGLITAQDASDLNPILNTPATRALVFYLADQAFYNFPYEDGTVYTTYVDNEAPALSVDAVAELTTDATVTVTGSTDGETVFVNGEAVAVDADGNFSAEIALELGENTIAVSAFDLAGNAAVEELTVTRTTGAAAHIQVSDITVAAGESVELAAVVHDANGNEIADAEIAVEATAGTYADGVYTAPETVGEYTLTLTSGEATATVTVTVVAGELAKITADKTSVAVGDKVVLTATDAYGNEVEGVTFSTDSTDAVVGATNGVFVGAAAGKYTVTATKGDATATIEIGVFGDASKLAVSTPAEVVANGETFYAFTVSTVDENGNVVTTESNAYVRLSVTGGTVYLEDQSTAQNFAQVKDGSYTFYVKIPTAVAGQALNVTAEHVNSSNQLITTNALTTFTGTVDAVRQVASGFKLEANSDYVTVNDSGSVTVVAKVVDQEGVPIKGGVYEVNVTVSGPATLADTDGVLTTVNGEANIVVNNQKGVTGTITVTASVEGFGSATETINAVIAGAADRIALSTYDSNDNAATSIAATERMKVVAKVQDANGIDVDYDQTLKITFSEGAQVKAYASANSNTAITTIPATNGVATFYLEADSNYTGTFTLTVDNATGSADLSETSTQITVVPGPYTKVALDRVGTIKVPVSNTAVTLSAKLYDAKGNQVAAKGVELTFTSTPGAVLNGEDESVTVTTDANGVATITGEFQPFSGTQPAQYTITVSGKQSDGTTDLQALNSGDDDVIVDVDYSVVASMSADVLSYVYGTSLGELYLDSSDENSAYVLLKITATDTYGAPININESDLTLTGDEGIFWNATTDKLVDADTAPVTWFVYGETITGLDASNPLNNTAVAKGEHYALVRVAKAGLVSLGAKVSTGTADVVATDSLVVNAGGVSKATLAEATDGAITVQGGTVAGPFTVQLTDFYGNPVSSNTKVELGVSMNNGGSVRTTADGIAVTSVDTYGTATIYLTTPAAGGYTLTFTSGNTPIGTVTVTAE